ncbi:unnamed protein product, partial [Ectocarpus sp. 8 AP-2014]
MNSQAYRCLHNQLPDLYYKAVDVDHFFRNTSVHPRFLPSIYIIPPLRIAHVTSLLPPVVFCLIELNVYSTMSPFFFLVYIVYVCIRHFFPEHIHPSIHPSLLPSTPFLRIAHVTP